MENKEIYFIGASGRYYPFTIYDLNTDLSNDGAVYIFTKKNIGSYKALYIGQTDTLESDIYKHEKWTCVVRELVNSICVHFENDPSIRQQIEQDLIGGQNPICNDRNSE